MSNKIKFNKNLSVNEIEQKQQQRKPKNQQQQQQQQQLLQKTSATSSIVANLTQKHTQLQNQQQQLVKNTGATNANYGLIQSKSIESILNESNAGLLLKFFLFAVLVYFEVIYLK